MSSSTSDLNTVTEERTEISVEQEEVTLYECPCCEQTVDEDELVPVTLGDDETTSVACEYCARSLFGFERDSQYYNIAKVVGEKADTLADILIIPLLKLVVPLGSTLLVGFFVFNQMLTTIEQSAEQMASALAPLPVPLLMMLGLPIFLIYISALLE